MGGGRGHRCVNQDFKVLYNLNWGVQGSGADVNQQPFPGIAQIKKTGVWVCGWGRGEVGWV